MRALLLSASTDGYRDPADNRARTDALIRALGREPDARLVIVPAGYWTARRSREVNDVIAEVMHAVFAAIGTRPLTLLGGVDALPVPDPDRLPSLVKRDRLPFEAFALHDGDAVGPWRQISTTSDTAALAPSRALDTLSDRVLKLDGRRLLPLVCGEMHSPAIRARAAALAPALVAVLGHAGLGQGLVPTLRSVHAATRTPVLHTQHLSPSSSGQHHWVDRRGTARHAALSIERADDERASAWLSARSIAL
jgi:hypothetical protein